MLFFKTKAKRTEEYVRYTFFLKSGRKMRTKWVKNEANITQHLGREYCHNFRVGDLYLNAAAVEAIEVETK
jgi:hypothetical protein